MIKRIVFLALAGLILVGCGVNCKSEPPRKSEYIQGGGYGMVHHFRLYDPQGDAGHTPSLKCTQYTYTKTDLYSDDLGNVTADEIVWIDLRGNNAYPAEQKNQMKIYLSKNKVIISGHTGEYAYLNGTYPVK